MDHGKIHIKDWVPYCKITHKPTKTRYTFIVKDTNRLTIKKVDPK